MAHRLEFPLAASAGVSKARRRVPMTRKYKCRVTCLGAGLAWRARARESVRSGTRPWANTGPRGVVRDAPRWEWCTSVATNLFNLVLITRSLAGAFSFVPA